MRETTSYATTTHVARCSLRGAALASIEPPRRTPLFRACVRGAWSMRTWWVKRRQVVNVGEGRGKQPSHSERPGDLTPVSAPSPLTRGAKKKRRLLFSPACGSLLYSHGSVGMALRQLLLHAVDVMAETPGNPMVSSFGNTGAGRGSRWVRPSCVHGSRVVRSQRHAASHRVTTATSDARPPVVAFDKRSSLTRACTGPGHPAHKREGEGPKGLPAELPSSEAQKASR